MMMQWMDFQCTSTTAVQLHTSTTVLNLRAGWKSVVLCFVKLVMYLVVSSDIQISAVVFNFLVLGKQQGIWSQLKPGLGRWSEACAHVKQCSSPRWRAPSNGPKSRFCEVSCCWRLWTMGINCPGTPVIKYYLVEEFKTVRKLSSPQWVNNPLCSHRAFVRHHLCSSG